MFEVAVVLHVLAATVWTGGHIILATTVLPRALKAGDPKIVEEFESGYERLAKPSLVVQVVTGVWLAYAWIPSVAGWFAFDSQVSAFIGIKILLLAATLVLAIDMRIRVAPRVSPANMRPLAIHVIAVTVLSVLLVVLGVGVRVGGFF